MLEVSSWEELQTIMDGIRPNLLEILKDAASTFLTELDASVAQRQLSDLNDLFGRYPVVYDVLEDAIRKRQQAGEQRQHRGGLFGIPRGVLPRLYYCDVGHHIVREHEVSQRDVVGRALCPVHDVPIGRTHS
jgi:hypothetical protein